MTTGHRDIDIAFSDEALRQIYLILHHDYTKKGRYFRLHIGGKGCSGFTYEMGFDIKREDDIEIHYPFNHAKGFFSFIVDPFSAFYCRSGEIDYAWDDITKDEGFFFNNSSEHLYHGKFFKNQKMLPHHLERQEDRASKK